MADDNDIPPVPLPPDDAKVSPAVPPVEAAPAVPPAAPAGDAAAPAAPGAPEPPAAPAAPAAPVTPAAPAAPAAPGAAYGPAAGGATPPPPAYGSPTAYGQPAYAPAPAGPAQGLSITSMVLGIVGLLFSLFGWGFLIALGAVITGHIAQKRQPYAKPFWLTGIITGYIGIGISVIWVLGILAFAIFAASISGPYY